MAGIDIECLRPNKPEELFKELCEECSVSSSWFRSPTKSRVSDKKKTTRCYRWTVHEYHERSYIQKRHLAAAFLKRKATEGLTNFSAW